MEDITGTVPLRQHEAMMKVHWILHDRRTEVRYGWHPEKDQQLSNGGEDPWKSITITTQIRKRDQGYTGDETRVTSGSISKAGPESRLLRTDAPRHSVKLGVGFEPRALGTCGPSR
eukprot:2837249-Rhodomonas_salina.2